jgi:hypothetical protein
VVSYPLGSFRFRANSRFRDISCARFVLCRPLAKAEVDPPLLFRLLLLLAGRGGVGK